MTKNNWLLVLFAVVLFGVYAVYFSDWFRPKTIGIFHAVRGFHPRWARPGTMPGLIFGINRQMRLDDVRVVPADGFATNKNILPLWHLVTDSNSVPIKSFYYGEPVRGMQPAIKGTHPDDLVTNVPYLLILRSGKITGEHPFELK